MATEKMQTVQNQATDCHAQFSTLYWPNEYECGRKLKL